MQEPPIPIPGCLKRNTSLEPIKKLGQGQFSTVWLAKIKVSGKRVAVKFPNVVNTDTFDDLMYEMDILCRFQS